MKGAAALMKELEILSIPDPKGVLKLRQARMTSSSEISEKMNVSGLNLILYAPSIKGFFS